MTTIQMAFKIWTICYPNNFPPLQIGTSPVFKTPLYLLQHDFGIFGPIQGCARAAASLLRPWFICILLCFTGQLDSGIYKVHDEIHVALFPQYLNNIKLGLYNYLNKQINRWHPKYIFYGLVVLKIKHLRIHFENMCTVGI